MGEPLGAHPLSWCEKRDLNPYGVTTRPSNVRVCQFRHSRMNLTNDIIAQRFPFVNGFFEIIPDIFSQLYLEYSTLKCYNEKNVNGG